jgi:ArsR family transcriptional regulator
VLRPGGRVLVLDLREHEETWVRTRLGDRWPGFSEERLQALIAAAGFERVTVRIGARTPGDPFVVLIAAGTKPDAARRRPTAPAPAARRRPGRAGISSRGSRA